MQVKTSQALRSGKYAAAYLAEQRRKNNDGNNEVDGGDRPPPEKFRSNELILPPIDYPETVHGVFLRGARGYFAESALTIKYVHIRLRTTTASDHPVPQHSFWVYAQSIECLNIFYLLLIFFFFFGFFPLHVSVYRRGRHYGFA